MIMSAILLLSAQAPAATTAPPPLVMPPPPALTGPRAEIVREPEARQPIETLFSPYDYPAAGDGVRGVVSVVLTIDPGGRVVSCGIQQSSSNELSRATCNILRRRARFTPATDALGNPVIGTVKAQVDWDEVFQKFGMN
jgi:periplasmic protein TonB